MPKQVIIVEADNVPAAIEEGLTRLGKEKSEVEIKILQEEQPGLFDQNTEPARVKLTAEGTDLEKLIRNLVADMLDLLNIQNYSLKITPDNKIYRVEILTPESSKELIGPEGKTINAIQSLVEEQVNIHSSEPLQIVVDSDHFRRERAEKLKKMARLVAEQVKRENQEIELPPMIELERKTIHAVIDEIPEVKAHAIGEGDNRRIVIIPRGKS
ncbi:MAG: R3H domain-containing nucleic acid-binding protein [bacterium]